MILDFSCRSASTTTYGSRSAGGELRGGFDPKQFEADRISAVQYVRFSLGPELARSLADPSVEVNLRVDHPAYQHATPLTGEARASLTRDLGA